MADFRVATSETTGHDPLTAKERAMKLGWKSWITMLASCLLLWTESADAHGGGRVKTAVGGFTSSQQFPCDTLCTGGPLTGGITGTLYWHMDLMEPTDDPD